MKLADLGFWGCRNVAKIVAKAYWKTMEGPRVQKPNIRAPAKYLHGFIFSREYSAYRPLGEFVCRENLLYDFDMFFDYSLFKRHFIKKNLILFLTVPVETPNAEE